MSDDLSPQLLANLRAALRHLDGQAPEPPPLPGLTPRLARPLRSYPAFRVGLAFAVAALVGLPLWWLRSDDDAVGPDPSNTSDASSTSLPTTTITGASSSTVATIPGPDAGPVEFVRLSDPTGVFVASDLIESIPSQNGDTLTGTSWVVVAALADSPEGLVAVGHEQIGLRSVAAVWTSSDGGITWERVPSDPAVFGGIDHPIGNVVPTGLSMTTVAYGQGRFVALGFDTTTTAMNPVAWFSDDGLAWTRVSAASGPRPGAGDTSVSGVVALAGGFVGVGVDSSGRGSPTTVVWTSADGATWNSVNGTFPGNGDGVVADLGVVAGSIVAIGFSPEAGTPAAWVSDDGVVWAAAEIVDTNGITTRGTEMRRLAVTPTGAIAIGFTPSSPSGSGGSDLAVWITTDGSTWHRWGPSNLWDERVKVPGPVVAGPTGLVAIVSVEVEVFADYEPGVLVWTSADGATWDEWPASFLGRINDLAVVSGRYVAVGSAPRESGGDISEGGVVWDGAVWIAEVEPGDEVTPTTRNQYMFECLVGRGFGAVVEIVDGMVFAHPAPDQVAAFDAADVECMNLMQQELGPPPTVDPAEFYAQLLDTAECLVREGYHPTPAPTLAEFLAQWENPSDESFPWHPYEAVNPGREEWLRINRVCPQP